MASATYLAILIILAPNFKRHYLSRVFLMAPSPMILPIAHEQHKASTSGLCSAHRKLFAISLASLVSIMVLAGYCFTFSSPLTRHHALSWKSRVHRYHARLHANRTRVVPIPASSFQFTPEQELAAVTSFVTALAANILPPDIDASVPVDPQLVLEFDIRSSRAEEELEAMQEDVWTRHPVVLYAKKYSAASRAVKATLSTLKLNPEPTFIDVDTREDASVVAPVVTRLTGESQFPILLVGGRVVTIDALDSLQSSGALDATLAAAGASIGGAKRRGRV